MAVGYTNAPYGGNPIEVTLSRVATDVEGNRTEWQWAAYLTNARGAWGGENTWKLSGFASSGPHSFTPAGTGVKQTLGSGKFWKNHNSEGVLAAGTLTLTIASNNSWLGSGSVGQSSGTPPVIPRATTPTVSGAFEIGTAKTISLPRASSSFTHDVTYKLGSASGTVATGAGESVSWTPPTALLNQLPNSTSGTVTITVVTKNGATTVGTKTLDVTINVPSTVTPTVNSVTWTDTNPIVSANIGAFVQGMSVPKGVINATAPTGASITSKTLTVAGNVVAENTGFQLPMAGSVTASGKAVDSRGRSHTKAANFNVLSYQVPKATGVQVRRAASNGAVSELGTYLRLDMNATCSSLSVGGTQKNRLRVKIFTKPSGSPDSSYGDPRNNFQAATGTPLQWNSNMLIGGGSAYPVNQSFDVKIELTDNATSVPVAIVQMVNTGSVTMDWKAGAVGVGKYHENGTLDVAGEIYNHRGRTPDAAELTTQNLDTIVTPGMRFQTANANALTSRNYPVQLAGSLEVIPNNASNFVNQVYITYSTRRMFVRNLYTGTWTAWQEFARITDLPESIVGQVTQFAGATAPSGWLLCQGQAVSRTTYAALFGVLGTAYGAGNGSSTFNLPDLRGRVAAGLSSSDTEFNTLGKTFGAKTHTLTVAQMPSHTHTQNAHSHGQTIGWGAGSTGGSYGRTDSNSPKTMFSNVYSATATNNNTGGGGAHNNIQPTITLNYIIKT